MLLLLHGDLLGRETRECRLRHTSIELIKAGVRWIALHENWLRLLLVELRLLLLGWLLLDDLWAAKGRKVALVVDKATLIHILLPVVWVL